MVRAIRRRRTPYSRRASGLPTVLMVSALLLVAAFTIVGLGYNHLSVSNRLNGAVEAKCLAEAAVAKGMEELQVNKEFGKGSYTGPNPVDIVCTFPSSPSGANGVLTFTQATADLWEIPKSTNNFDGTGATGGSNGRRVPTDAVHLVGVGRCNGVVRTVEAVLYIPRYPYAISSSGPVQTDGGLYVASVESEGDISDPSKHAKGHLVTNSNAGANAVVLNGTGNKITGDLQSVSGATVGTSIIQGETRLNAAATEIPKINISTFDTTGKPGLKTLTSDTGPATTSSSPLNGFVRFDGGGTRTITFEQLHLDKGVMYVDGNLQVNQGIFGKGAIIVKGTTTVRGGGGLTSDNGVALLSGKKIDIAGDTSNPSVLKGLMYSEGGLSSKDMKLRGVFINNDETTNTPTNATSTEIVQTPENSNMQFQVQTSPGSSGVPGGNNEDPERFGYAIDPRNGGALTIGTIQAYGASDAPMPGVGSTAPLSNEVNVDFDMGLDPATNPDIFKVGSEYKVGYMHSGERRRSTLSAPGFVADPTAPLMTLSHLRVRVAGTPYPASNVAAWRAALKTEYKNKLVASKGSALTTGPFSEEYFADTYIDGRVDALTSGAAFERIASYFSSKVADANQRLIDTGEPVSFVNTTGTPSTPGTSETWKLNLSDFINRSERVRILYWRET